MSFPMAAGWMRQSGARRERVRLAGGHTPVVMVTDGHDTRVSLAALTAIRPGCRPRLIYRTHRARRGDKRKGFHRDQLDGAIVLVWDA